jgi:DNA-binding beta-propeller fold protein YncE
MGKSGDKLTYVVSEGWGQLPPGWTFKQVAGVAVDSADRVYVFNRGEHPMIVFDRAGQVVDSWGEGQFKSAHGICLDAKENLYLVDNGNHTMKKFSRDGKLLQAWGTEDAVGVDGAPFGGPTDAAVSPSGAVYVSDGYRNARVHKFSAEGELLLSWGEPGDGPSQFKLPHSVWVDRHEQVYVADRENHRIQIFSPQGEYLTQWTGFKQPTDIYIDADENVYVSELQHRVSIVDLEGNLIARWGGESSHAPGQFVAPHAVWTDSQGDLYVGEVLQGQRIQKFRRTT